jgi:hypothetical protein
MSENLDTYLSTSITGGASITPLAMLASLDGALLAVPNGNDPPQMVFKLDNSAVQTLHASNVKYEGIMSYSYDGTVFYGINVDAITPLLIKGLIDLNTDYQAYKTAHP